MTDLEIKKQELIEILGEENIRMVDPTGIHAMQKGVIVDIHIRRWRGRTRLDFADLGLPPTAEDQEYEHLLRLGDKKLLPKKHIGNKDTSYVDILDNVEARARHCLEVHSLETHWGRFVPYTLYAKWKIENEALINEYLGYRNEIFNRYVEIKTQLLTEYRAMAKVAWQRNQTLLQSQAVSEELFTDRFMRHIEGLVPTAEHIYNSFAYEVDLKFVPLPSDYEVDLARAEEIKRNEELKTEADRAQLTSIRSMNDDVIRQVRAQKMTMVDSFMGDVAKQIRAMMYDAVTDVLASIQKNNGKLVGKASLQLTNLINSIEGLNFYGDRDIDGMIKRVKAQLGDSVKDRSVAEISNTLTDIGTLTRANLIALGDTPRGGRGVGVAVEPTEIMVRQARTALKLDIEAVKIDVMGGRQAR